MRNDPRNLQHSDEATLLRAAQGGSTVAFGALILRHRSRLIAFARRVTDDPSSAEDAVQDASIRIWKRLRQLRDPGAFRAWAYAITLSAVRDAGKRRRRAVKRDTDWLEQAATGPVSDPDHAAALDIERAMRGLPEKERLLAALIFGAGFSHTEASAMTDIPLGSVKTFIARARDRLAESLAGWDHAGQNAPARPEG